MSQSRTRHADDPIQDQSSGKLGRLSDESPDVRGIDSAPGRGGEAPAISREGARDEDDSVDEMLGRFLTLMLALDSCDDRLAERDWLAKRCSGSGGLLGISTSVMVDDTPEARFMTWPSSTTLPFLSRCCSGGISLLERGAEMDDCDECAERVPDWDLLNDFRIDLRIPPFSACGTGGADAGKGGVIAGIGDTAGEG